jgi:hypothetical protein
MKGNLVGSIYGRFPFQGCFLPSFDSFGYAVSEDPDPKELQLTLLVPEY